MSADHPSSETNEVQHNVAQHRYEITVDGHLAIAEYNEMGRTRIMTHTFVPPELRGRGLAERLVRRALHEARAEGWKIVPACSYVATFVRRHPEYSELVTPSL